MPPICKRFIQVWVLVNGFGGFYPIQCQGRIAGYSTYEAADDARQAIEKHNKEYVEDRGGLKIETVIATPEMLKLLNIAVVQR